MPKSLERSNKAGSERTFIINDSMTREASGEIVLILGESILGIYLLKYSRGLIGLP